MKIVAVCGIGWLVIITMLGAVGTIDLLSALLGQLLVAILTICVVAAGRD